MAQDEVVVVYKAVPEGFDKVGVAVNSVTNETKELQTQIKATFADKSIENATKKLYEQGDVMGALINEYGNATSALKAMEKELITMAALGQNGTKEFKELAKATAELKDTVGDTRGEIKKMASDTRVFDTMVQGARGVAAAFSVATGVAAAFGSENKNVEKALLKVQGAMAALQGVQELANIATEKGGVATKAYGVALTVVDRISKLTGLSMAASWALATAGITLLIGGVVALIAYLDDATQESKRLEEQEKKRKQDFGGLLEEQLSALDDLDKKQENQVKLAKIRGENLIKLEKVQMIERLSLILELQKLYKYNHETNSIDDKTYAQVSTKLESERLNTLLKLRGEHTKNVIAEKKNQREKEKEIDGLQAYSLPDAPPKDYAKNFLEALQADIDIQKVPEVDVKFNVSPLSADLAAQKFITEFADSLNTIAPTVNALGGLAQAIFASETQALDEEKEKQLSIVGNNAERRAQIEKDYAIKRARIAREAAIADRSIASFNAVVNMATAISKTIADNGMPAAIPFIALAAATGALQIAAINAAPLPAIPKFEKGGAVALAGGRIDNGYLIGRSHREGGILIEAQGKEYIWDEQTTAKHGDIIQAAHENRIEDLMMHKYVVPMIRSQQQNNNSESYDDMLLRATIKSSNKQMSKEIVKGISKNMSDAIYLTSRYKS